MITINIAPTTLDVVGSASFKLKEAKEMHDVTKDEIFLFEGKICMKDKYYSNTIIYDLFTNEKIELSAGSRNDVCFTLELVEG